VQFEQALARARDAAESASRAKSAFLANTSHELRTPLNGMIGLARMARAPDIGEDRRRQYLDQIAESAQALAGVISDILDLSKIEAGKLQLETTTFDLGELLRRLQQSYTTLAGGARPEAAGGDRPQRAGHGQRRPAARAPDHQQLPQQRAEVHRARPDQPAGAPRRRWRHGARGSARHRPGHRRGHASGCSNPSPRPTSPPHGALAAPGWALSICRQLAGLMGGSVGVHSVVGEGSSFWAELPLPRAAKPLQPSRAAWASRPGSGESPLQGARVLMVEDNPVNMLIAVAMLERWGVHVTQAQDGSEAVAAVQAAAASGQPFHAVLMDVQMPVMSGHEATRACAPCRRAAPAHHCADRRRLVSERDEALRSGMNDFLTKPIDAALVCRRAGGGGLNVCSGCGDCSPCLDYSDCTGTGRPVR
jgi:CheY-like chemotaxis protein